MKKENTYLTGMFLFFLGMIVLGGLLHNERKDNAIITTSKDVKIENLTDSIGVLNNRLEPLENYQEISFIQNDIINESGKCKRLKYNNGRLQLLTNKIK